MAQNNNNNTPDDSYATSETIGFIKNLHDNYLTAKTKLAKLQAMQSNLETERKNIGEEYTRIRTEEKNAKDQLKETESALKSVVAITEFFRSRVKVTENLVNFSLTTATSMFQSLDQLKEIALERVESIKNYVIGKDNQPLPDGPANDPSLHWTQIFAHRVTETDAQGAAAFMAGAKAVQSAIQSYVSNQEIHARTIYHHKQFQRFVEELTAIIDRKESELALIHRKYILLDSKNKIIDLQVRQINTNVLQQQFVVAQTLAEYNAAQQGAEYKYKTPAA